MKKEMLKDHQLHHDGHIVDEDYNANKKEFQKGRKILI